MKEESEEAADPCLKLHHGAFEFATLDELLGSYTMVKALGIGPALEIRAFSLHLEFLAAPGNTAPWRFVRDRAN